MTELEGEVRGPGPELEAVGGCGPGRARPGHERIKLRLVVVCRQKLRTGVQEDPGGLWGSVARRIDRSVGGVQVHAENVAQYFDRMGHEVVIVTPWDGSPVAAVAASVVARLLGRIDPSRAERWRRTWNRRLLARSLSQRQPGLTAGAPIVFYAQDELTAEVALGVRPPGGVVVMAVHNAGSEANELWWDDLCSLGDRLYRQLADHHDRISAQVDGVLAVSNIGAEGFFLHTEKGRDLAHRVVYSFLADDWPVHRRPSPCERRDLITVGALTSTKNHRFLLEVLAETNRLGHHYTLTIVGNGPERDRLRTLYRDLNLEDQVSFLGARSDVPRILGAHRAYIHTSRMESGFPLALIEAMAQGLAVLAAPVGAIPEMLRDGIDGCHLPLHSAEAAARVLASFLEDAAAVERCGRSGRDRFEREFRASVGGARIEDFFEELLRGCADAGRMRSGA